MENGRHFGLLSGCAAQDVRATLIAILQLRLFKGNCLPNRFLWEVGEDEQYGLLAVRKRWRRLGKHSGCVVGKRISMVLHRCLAAAGQLHELATRWAQAWALSSGLLKHQVGMKFSRTVCFLACSQSGRPLTLWQAVRCPVTGDAQALRRSTRPRASLCSEKHSFFDQALAKELRSTFRTDDEKETCRTDSAQLGGGKRKGRLGEDSGKQGKKKKKRKKRKKKPTARGIPRRSPIQVLTPPDGAWLRWSDENRCFHRGMAVDMCSRSNALLIRSWQRAWERHHRCGPKVRTIDPGHSSQFGFRVQLTGANSLAKSQVRRCQRVDFSSYAGHWRQPCRSSYVHRRHTDQPVWQFDLALATPLNRPLYLLLSGLARGQALGCHAVARADRMQKTYWKVCRNTSEIMENDWSVVLNRRLTVSTFSSNHWSWRCHLLAPRWAEIDRLASGAERAREIKEKKQLAIADAGAAAAAAQSEGETSSRRACGSRKADRGTQETWGRNGASTCLLECECENASSKVALSHTLFWERERKRRFAEAFISGLSVVQWKALWKLRPWVLS